MKERLVIISSSAINSIGFSSIFNIGDTIEFNPTFNGIAVQREGIAWNDAYDLQFDYYSIFKRKAKWLSSELPIQSEHFHHQNYINVGTVSITGVSQSSTVQHGSLKKINAESRVKHFRLLKEE
ncbi:spore germination protein GerPE [Ornithinibacillus halotolerans]|uniref:Spore germination protein GerPE n=1 Tax=Ornithinibacillus halotolerans TaxID=1274357 RepID=A0A916W7C8_9BACI|nr:spore germination protein GerPE [Ornithinibacillus halotolerans]GGA73747.1 hypothetical protein GCM10008025_16800 [Ornithinibacillus halotolerans]